MLLLAKDHLSRYPGAPVIFTVSNSSLLETEVKKWGGRPVMCKVGHSFVEHAMREEKSLLGGEQSGHFFCGEDYYGFDDAIVAGLRILAILSTPRVGDPLPIKKEQCLMKESTLSPQAERSLPTKMMQSKKNIDGSASPRRVLLSQFIAEFPIVFQSPERRPECADDKKAEVVRKATEHFQKQYPVVTLDGARIDFGEGAWAGIRYSNTSPCLSICLEARTESALRAMEKEVLEHLGTYSDVRMD
jgi:phosphomannomutase/phosphoglucomutase